MYCVTMVKQAFKKQYIYSNPGKYRLFLKKQFTRLEPRWYSITHHQEVLTIDGPMVAAKIIYNEIENPHLEIIAEVWINDEYIYLWRDHCWTIAVDKGNKPICELLCGASWHEIFDPNQFTLPPPCCNKVLLLHKIGSQTVE